jgi:hypothetical protein
MTDFVKQTDKRMTFCIAYQRPNLGLLKSSRADRRVEDATASLLPLRSAAGELVRKAGALS